MLTLHLSESEGLFFSLCLCLLTNCQKSLKYCAKHKDINSPNSSPLESWFGFSFFLFFFHLVYKAAMWLWLSSLLIVMSAPCKAAGVGFHRTKLGHQWLSILWLKELASCCTCYARGVMFLSPWFTEQSVYWRRFKIHYRLVLPRKIVEEHSKIEVRTGLLQEKT